MFVVVLFMNAMVTVGSLASVFRNDKRTFWDRLAGTRVRYRSRG